eukprot:8982411-Pyramimonas_sp.AAC.1
MDEDTEQVHKDLMNDLGVWAATWTVAMDNNEGRNHDNWKLWCEPYMQQFRRQPGQVRLLQFLRARYQTRSISSI